jgi:hypothetical protein
MIVLSQEAAYWVAIAHLTNWSREKINDFFDRLLRNHFAFHDFFALKPEEWESLFHLSREEITTLQSIQEKLPYYLTITQKISEQGFDIIPVHSRFILRIYEKSWENLMLQLSFIPKGMLIFLIRQQRVF